MSNQARKTGHSFVLLALLVLLLCALDTQAQTSRRNAHRELTVNGTSVLEPLVSDIARRFERSHTGVRITVQPGGSAQALAAIRGGTADIAMLPRSLRDAERELFAFPLARDGVAVIVNRDNPVRHISMHQLKDVLTGRVTNWKVLGGRDAPVHVAWRSKGQGSVEFILEHLTLKHEQIGPHITIGSNNDAIRFAAADANGIALASLGIGERSARNGTPIKLISYNGTPAATDAIENHTYSLARPLTLVTRRLPEGLQKQFIDFALSKDVIDTEVKHGFVPYQE